MINPSHHSPFTPSEIVKLRRSLVTSGEYAECPRCHTELHITRARTSRVDARRLGCEHCGGSLTLPDTDRELFSQ